MKITRNTNVHVAIYPTPPGCFPGLASVGRGEWKEGEAEAACKEILAQIHRHVDGCSGARGELLGYVMHDVEETCSHCGLEWEVDDDGCPVCCDAAVEEYEHETKTA